MQSGIVSQSETITQSEHIPLLLHEGRRKTEMPLSECKKVAFHVKYMCVFFHRTLTSLQYTYCKDQIVCKNHRIEAQRWTLYQSLLLRFLTV